MSREKTPPFIASPRRCRLNLVSALTLIALITVGIEVCSGEVSAYSTGEDSTGAKAVRAFGEGDYMKASVLFRMALEDEPGSEVLRSNLAETLVARAWEDFKAEDFSSAEALFTEALEYKRKPAFIKGLATAQVRLGELEQAARTLESAGGDVEADKMLANLYLGLGNKMKKAGELDRALEYYEKSAALTTAPDPEGRLKEVIRKLKGELSAEAGFRTKAGIHFNVKFSGGEDVEAGYLVGLLLEEAYFTVGAEFGYYPDVERGGKIGAVLYPKERFRDVTRSPAWAGALYDGRIKIPTGGVTAKTAPLRALVFHEYTHAVVHRLSQGRAPVWLNEGLAQYLEGKRSASYRATIEAVTNFNGKGPGRVSLKALEGSFLKLSSREANVVYALSLSAVEFIVDQYGLYAIKAILKGLSEGDTLPRAISKVIYVSYEELNQSWLDEMKGSS